MLLSGIAAAGEDARARVMTEFRRRGGSLDGVARDRGSRADRERLADALTHVEGELELEARGRWTAPRLALRDIRRRLEWELWP